MANINGTSSPVLAEIERIAGFATASPSFLQELPRQFNDDAMGGRDRLLGIAGRMLNRSFETVYAIGGLSDLVRASRMEGDFQLGDNAEAQLLTAISLLSGNLNELLCDVAQSFREELRERAQ